MEFTTINGTSISQMSSIFIPIRENRQVEPRKQQQQLLAPSASASGTKRKLAQMKYGDNDVMYQMNRDKRLRFDHQQNNSSSLSIGVQKSSGNAFNSEQHRQSYSSAIIPATGAVDLFSPSTAAIFHSMTAESTHEPIGRVINTNNVLLNAICNSSTPAASTNISLKKSNSKNGMLVLLDHAAHDRWTMPPPPPKFNADDGSKQQGISTEFKTIGDYKERKAGQNISNNETDEGRFLNAFANSKALYKTELEKLTGLPKSKIAKFAAKFCEKTNPSSQRSKLRLKPAITTLSNGHSSAAAHFKEHRPMMVTTMTQHQQQLVKRKIRSEDEDDHHPSSKSKKKRA